MKPEKTEPPFEQSRQTMHSIPSRSKFDRRHREPVSEPALPQKDNDGSIEDSESAVMLVHEVAATLRITRNQIQRLEKRGAFPIPRLPKLDRHPRYARALVERFLAGANPSCLIKRRRR